ncbi:unnamed protein product [Protopolystoma xenopodis]|uniref:Uncharacterized protein n=1 Tax=Protopolystoma xenopodis TaxID=117903 RepID=A0A448XMH4_9PLAT|nr:unnamed protein product [Protopolystoma xenopodis]
MLHCRDSIKQHCGSEKLYQRPGSTIHCLMRVMRSVPRPDGELLGSKHHVKNNFQSTINEEAHFVRDRRPQLPEVCVQAIDELLRVSHF